MHRLRRFWAFMVTLLFVAEGHAQLARNEPPPKAPEESLACIKVRPGFRVELVAAEPLVQSPVAFAWGPDGKFWVVEMGDYPLGLDGRGKPGGRVKFLEDTDGDGKYDKATVFLDGLGFPTGVLPWRKGVLVTCAPDIFYAEDTDGDGKADKRDVLFTGFLPGNQQHRVNTLAWGLDNWVYCANGDSGGLVTSPRRKQGPLNISGRDFRIRPDTGEIDAQTGQTQFGRCRDDWGNWFGGNNSNPLWHFALEDHYLRRNPHVAAPNPRVNVPVVPGAAPVFPISKTLPRFNDWHTANRFTSACSPTIYRDELFDVAAALRDARPPPRSVGTTMVFVCEPVHNLVHREVMTPKGFTFTSRRADDEQQSEFLASSDNWFRPVFAQTGPDGALWIADMYRHVIEHPQWIPQFWQQKLDLRAGHDRGRIYRVYPADRKLRAMPRLDKLDTAGLVAALDSPNGWQRDTAQQMLLWRGDKAAVPFLAELFGKAKRPLTRLHALCTLDGLKAGSRLLAVRTLALTDPHPAVRRHAIRLCEASFTTSIHLGDELTRLLADTDPQVRLQLAYTLGAWDDPRAGQALGELAQRDGGDPYMLAAILSSVNMKNLEPLLTTVLASGRVEPGRVPPAVLDSLLRVAHAYGDHTTLATLLETLAMPEKGRHAAWQLAALASLLDALDQRNHSLKILHDDGDARLKAAVKDLERVFAYVRFSLTTVNGDPEARLLAFRLLGRGLDSQEEDVDLMGLYLAPATAGELRAAAVAGLGRLRLPRAAEVLLYHWKGYSPTVRTQVLDALLPREDGVKAVLAGLEKGNILPSEIDAARRQRLLTHRALAFRLRAAKRVVDAVNPDRQKVIEAYRAALTAKSDPGRGKPLFTKHCAACHKFDGQGNDVGPEIGSVGDKSPEGLLVALLDPNRAVEARYLNYIAETKNGRALSGVLTSETGTSITLVGADGKPQTVLRTELEDLASTGKSAMPEGLEKDLTPQEVADVIAYVRAGTLSPQRKVFAGNDPAVVVPESDRSLHLKASTCEIYGSTLVLERKHGNLGYWQSADDHAVWTVDVRQAGRYAVHLDWACDDKSAGNTLVLEAGQHRFMARVEGTGGWDIYRQEKIGTTLLAEGRQRVTLRAEGKIAGALLDLKAIRLVWSGAK